MNRRRMLLSSGGISLPEGYTAIAYLESDGNRYIDTGFVPNQDTRVKMSILASGLSGETYAYGARNSAGSNVFLCALEPSAITFGYAIQYRAYEGVIDGRYDIDHNKNIMTVNGTELSGNYVESFSSESNLTLFGRNTAGSVERLSAIKIYSCQIYDNDALVRDYIPAKNSNGQQGLYDLKNNVWYALKPAYGCYIQDTTGKLWTSDAWDGSATPNGVAVVTEDCKFVMALYMSTSMPMDSNGYSYNMNLPVYDSFDDAITDYSGSSNTTALISAYGNTRDEPAGYCSKYIFPNWSSGGYLGSAGEWQAAYDNKSAVDACISAVGGAELGVGRMWSSTRASDYDDYNRFWALSWSSGDWGDFTTIPIGNVALFARAFIAL